MSNLTLNKLSALNPSTHLITVESGDTVYSPGSVVQVIQTALMTPTAVSIPANVSAFTNIPDFFAIITPKKSTSKIMVSVNWFGEFSAQTVAWETMFGIKRNGSPVGHNTLNTGTSAFGTSMASISYYANDGASTPEMCTFQYLDSPNTGVPVTYHVYANSNIASTLYTNRAVGGTGEFGISTITLWEIAQ